MPPLQVVVLERKPDDGEEERGWMRESNVEGNGSVPVGSLAMVRSTMVRKKRKKRVAEIERPNVVVVHKQQVFLLFLFHQPCPLMPHVTTIQGQCQELYASIARLILPCSYFKVSLQSPMVVGVAGGADAGKVYKSNLFKPHVHVAHYKLFSAMFVNW